VDTRKGRTSEKQGRVLRRENTIVLYGKKGQVNKNLSKGELKNQDDEYLEQSKIPQTKKRRPASRLLSKRTRRKKGVCGLWKKTATHTTSVELKLSGVTCAKKRKYDRKRSETYAVRLRATTARFIGLLLVFLKGDVEKEEGGVLRRGSNLCIEDAILFQLTPKKTNGKEGGLKNHVQSNARSSGRPCSKSVD